MVKNWSGTDSEYAFTHTISEEVEVFCAECGRQISHRLGLKHCLSITILPHSCPVDEAEVDGTPD